MATKSKSKSPAQEPIAGAKLLKDLIKKKIGEYARINRQVVSLANSGYSTYTIEVVGSCRSFKFESESEKETMKFLIAGLKTMKDWKEEE